MASNPLVRPDVTGGVPRCTYDACPSYDGKRCAVLGFRPDAICEPAVIEMAGQVRELATQVSELRAELGNRQDEALTDGRLDAFTEIAAYLKANPAPFCIGNTCASDCADAVLAMRDKRPYEWRRSAPMVERLQALSAEMQKVIEEVRGLGDAELVGHVTSADVRWVQEAFSKIPSTRSYVDINVSSAKPSPKPEEPPSGQSSPAAPASPPAPASDPDTSGESK